MLRPADLDGAAAELAKCGELALQLFLLDATGKALDELELDARGEFRPAFVRGGSSSAHIFELKSPRAQGGLLRGRMAEHI